MSKGTSVKCDYCGKKEPYIPESTLQYFEVSTNHKKKLDFCKDECLVRYFKEKNNWI